MFKYISGIRSLLTGYSELCFAQRGGGRGRRTGPSALRRPKGQTVENEATWKHIL